MACCSCPYGKQRVLLTTQIVMGLTFFLSILGWWFTWVCGIAAWSLIMALACAKVNRFVLVCSGTLATLAALGQFLMAAFAQRVNVYCVALNQNMTSIFTDDFFNGTRTHHLINFTSILSSARDNHIQIDDDEFAESTLTSKCRDFLHVLTVAGIVTGIGWVISALLVVLVAVHLKQKEDSTLWAWHRHSKYTTTTTTTTTTPSTTTTPALPPGTVTNETTHLPDGSTKMTRFVVNEDGSETITERILPPPPTTTTTLPLVVDDAQDDTSNTTRTPTPPPPPPPVSPVVQRIRNFMARPATPPTTTPVFVTLTPPPSPPPVVDISMDSTIVPLPPPQQLLVDASMAQSAPPPTHPLVVVTGAPVPSPTTTNNKKAIPVVVVTGVDVEQGSW